MNMLVKRRRKSARSERAHEGMIIRGAGNAPRQGTLGLFLANGANETLFGLTAAHIIQNDGAVFMSDGQALGLVRRTQQPTGHLGADYISIEETLGLFAIDAGVQASVATNEPIASSRSSEDAFGSLGSEVRRLRRDGTLASARLCAVEGSCAFRSAMDGRVRRYHGALEIVSSEKDIPFASFGDSGSVVYSRNGSILGIVIGGIGRKCFAAPLHGFFSRTGFSPANPANLRKHNERVHAEISQDWSVVADFGRALRGEAVNG